MKASNRIFRLLVTGLALLAASCGKEEPVTPDPILKLAQGTVASGKGSQFVSVVATGKWTLSSEASWVKFTPAAGTGNNDAVALSYEANPDEKARVADIRLSCGGKSTVVTLRQNAKQDDPQPEETGGSSTKRRWMELPETKDGDGLNFYTHDMTLQGRKVRNYSFYWDSGNLVARWVAYPLNNALRGSGSRTDAWALDPLLPASQQPVVTSTFRNGWTRGHQIPSADRLNSEANAATFYGTNMTPQDYDFNGEIWARLEGTVRSWASKSDTLYVVTGCVVNGSSQYTTDVTGKRITVPVAYYKAVLSKTTSSAAHGGYLGCAVYLEHTHNPGETVARNHSSVLSVRELEKKIGVNLFVNLPDAVGSAVAEQIETENPNTVSWWW
ncbi:MAG: DNA/RNA non-specific endonuclease [Bacteroidales bacterium]|nr:DNA/RNA non-specific endonuclease [Bacteroidales bacterium]